MKPDQTQDRPPHRRAAAAAAAGFLAIAIFQLALSLGAPLGRAAWGGTYSRIPSNLRIASGFAVVFWTIAAFIVLGRAGYRLSPFRGGFVRWGTWVVAGVSALGALLNFASASNWERFLWGPVALILAALSFLVARGGTGALTPASAKHS